MKKIKGFCFGNMWKRTTDKKCTLFIEVDIDDFDSRVMYKKDCVVTFK